jgi:hypothetical protein
VKYWILVLALVVGGCKDSPPPAKVTKAKVEPTTAAQSPEDERTLKEQREAFGIPLPPEITSVSRGDSLIVATTKLRLPEVMKFYEGKLPEYEVIPGPRNTTYVPLREYAPEIFAEQLSYGSPTDLSFRLAKKPLPPEEHVELKPGDTVHFKMPDGQELAPGAVYGEAYTPPPGSPLADPRYKSNWGKPFGSWVPQ